MPSRYLEILSVQPPSPFMVDASQRSHFTINFECTIAAPAADFEGEIAALIVNATLGTKWTGVSGDLFVGRDAKIPVGDGPFVVVVNTGGYPPLETHNADKYERRTFQIVVIALVYSVAKTRAEAIWRALDGVRNTTVTAV